MHTCHFRVSASGSGCWFKLCGLIFHRYRIIDLHCELAIMPTISFVNLPKIDFSERIWWVLLMFHSLVLLVTLISLRWRRIQLFILASIGVVVFCAPYINAAAVPYFRSPMGKNYFDPQGRFISLTFSVPHCVLPFLWRRFSIMSSSLCLIQRRGRLSCKSRDKQQEAREAPR